MQVLHRRLVENSPAYRIWHDSPISSIVHLIILSAFIIAVVATLTAEPKAHVAAVASGQIDTGYTVIGPVPPIEQGTLTQAPIQIVSSKVDALMPEVLRVAIYVPQSGLVVGNGEVQINASVAGLYSPQQVTISVDGTALTHCGGIPVCSALWPTRALSPGIHEIIATARDPKGNSAIHTIAVFKQ